MVSGVNSKQIYVNFVRKKTNLTNKPCLPIHFRCHMKLIKAVYWATSKEKKEDFSFRKQIPLLKFNNYLFHKYVSLLAGLQDASDLF